jgi:hypothetical protein
MSRRLLSLFVATFFGLSCRFQVVPASYPYRAAMYTGLSGVSSKLTVFPVIGEAFDIQLPFQPGPYAYSPDGKAIYATNFAEEGFNSDGTAKRRSLFRIELFPMHVIPVYGLEAIGIADLAISDHGDKIAVFGGMHGSCGIFELSPPNQEVKRFGCGYFRTTLHAG